MPQNASVVMDGAGPRRIWRIPRQLRQDPDMTFSALFAARPRGPWLPTSRSGDTCVSRYRRDRQSASLTPSGHGASFSVALFSSYQGMILSLLRASTLLLSGGAM